MEKLGLQGSVQWLMDRTGKVTASRFKDVLAKLKSGGNGKSREDYLWEVVIERLTGNPTDHYANAAMQWGTEQEAFARMRYESATGAIVEEVGFLQHPELDGVGGSPDGLVGEDGGCEFKCPFNSAVHLRTVLDGMPPEHMPQVQGLMWITGRAWWDFVSFDPRLPAPLDLHIQRIARDEGYIANLESEVGLFLADADALIRQLRPDNESAPQEESADLRQGMPPDEPAPAPTPAAADPDGEFITADQALDLESLLQESAIPLDTFKKKAGVERLSQIRASRYRKAVEWISKHRKEAA